MTSIRFVRVLLVLLLLLAVSCLLLGVVGAAWYVRGSDAHQGLIASHTFNLAEQTSFDTVVTVSAVNRLKGSARYVEVSWPRSPGSNSNDPRPSIIAAVSIGNHDYSLGKFGNGCLASGNGGPPFGYNSHGLSSSEGWPGEPAEPSDENMRMSANGIGTIPIHVEVMQGIYDPPGRVTVSLFEGFNPWIPFIAGWVVLLAGICCHSFSRKEVTPWLTHSFGILLSAMSFGGCFINSATYSISFDTTPALALGVPVVIGLLSFLLVHRHHRRASLLYSAISLAGLTLIVLFLVFGVGAAMIDLSRHVIALTPRVVITFLVLIAITASLAGLLIRTGRVLNEAAAS